jgi:hypothetical protein
MSSVAREGLWTSGAESLRILKIAGIGEDEEMVCAKTGAPKKTSKRWCTETIENEASIAS